LNVGEVGRFDDASLIETERFPDGMLVLVVDIKTDDFVLSPAVERETFEVVARAIYAGGIHVSEMSRLLNFLACVKVLTRSLDSREFREFMETVADGIKPRVIIIYSPEAKSLASMAKSWTRPSSKHSETRVSTSRN